MARKRLDGPQRTGTASVTHAVSAGEQARLLLERDQELAVLGRRLVDVERGRGQIGIVEARAGLGKTSLLRAVCASASDHGFTCLQARASELEHDFAFGLVRQLLEPVVLAASPPEREQLFDGAASLAEPLFTSPESPSPEGLADARFSILHGLYWLVNNLTSQAPVVLALDDLHWADLASLRFLVYLTPRLEGLPVAVVASTRPGEGEIAELMRLVSAPEATVLRLKPLSIEATRTLCERALGPGVAPAFAAACLEATGGNPFFLEALLREAREQGLGGRVGQDARVREIGPAEVAHTVLLRLSAAPPGAMHLVRSLSVLGDSASLREVAELAELAQEEAAGLADLLVAFGLFAATAKLEFVHPIVREAVYADIGPRERALAHARAESVLAELGASEERIAAQITRAEPVGDPRRVTLLRRVAAEAMTRGAPTVAATYLGRALAEPPRFEVMGDVLLELGLAELRTGSSEAAAHLAQALQLLPDPALLTTAARNLANALTMAGESDRAVAALVSTVDAIQASDRERALLLEADIAAHAQQASLEARASAVRRLEGHAGLGGRTAGERLVLASVAFERARACESAERAGSLLAGALAGGRLVDEQDLDVTGPFYLLILGLGAADALDLAQDCLDRALYNARARASIPAIAFLFAHRAWILMRRGAVGDAESDARTALELLTSHDIELGQNFARATLIEALLENGDLEQAAQALATSDGEIAIAPRLANNFLLDARARLRLAQDRPGDALADLLEFGRRDELWGAANPLASRWRSTAALALVASADVDAARRMAAEDLERARRWGAASGIGIALRSTALVSDHATRECLREAVHVLDASPARLEHSRVLADLGAALRRANHRAEARAALERAIELAKECGAGALVERARTELLAAGGRSSDPFGRGVERLTVSERRVAELAAQGRNNPEIAQALFVTRKTVETHLGRVYRKLDIAGRSALPQALGDERQAGD